MSKTLSILMLFVCVWMTAVARPKNDIVSVRSKEASPTTMDSLEAHVWTTLRPESFSVSPYAGGSVIFLMFRNNIIYYRRYYDGGKWYAISSEPFYFYTPGKENIMDTNANPYHQVLFLYSRVGQRQNGRHIVLDYDHREFHPHPIMTELPSSRRVRGAMFSLDILNLNDSVLTVKRNADYTEPEMLVGSLTTTFHATDLPFPWDENIDRGLFDFPKKPSRPRDSTTYNKPITIR